MSALLAPGVAGNRKTMLIKVMNSTAISAIGKLYTSSKSVGIRYREAKKRTKMPKLNGPGVKVFVPRYRAAMGIVYAMYSATTDSEKTALMA